MFTFEHFDSKSRMASGLGYHNKTALMVPNFGNNITPHHFYLLYLLVMFMKDNEWTRLIFTGNSLHNQTACTAIELPPNFVQCIGISKLIFSDELNDFEYVIWKRYF